MSNLRRELIKLGSEQKHLRPYIKSILAGLDTGRATSRNKVSIDDRVFHMHKTLKQLVSDKKDFVKVSRGSIMVNLNVGRIRFYTKQGYWYAEIQVGDGESFTDPATSSFEDFARMVFDNAGAILQEDLRLLGLG